ncbi:hypothetical protein ACJW30_05G128200 [Castanea mollissima]
MSYSFKSFGLLKLENEKYTAYGKDDGCLISCSYHLVPIVFSQAKGSSVWDPEGNKYLDFLAAYSTVNQGHCHPKIMKVLKEQAERLTLSSRAFYNDKFPTFAGYLRIDYFNNYIGSLWIVDTSIYILTLVHVAPPMVTSSLLLLSSVLVPFDENILAFFFLAIIVSCCGCFHGRTLAVISMSCDNDFTRGFGPLLPGHIKVDFGDAVALEKIFKENGDRIAGFLFEPIQGEAGVQSGLARTGKMLACDWEEVRPDVVILGKALGGGVVPVSAVLADKDVMLSIQPREHGSTFGRNPLASAVAIASLDVIRDERFAERHIYIHNHQFENHRRTLETGKEKVVVGHRELSQGSQKANELRHHLLKIQQQYPNYMREVQGRGLFNAVELNSKNLRPISAYDICL